MSVGHAARVVEDTGIPTVAIFVKAFRFHAENMKLPRTVVTHHPMSRPMGAPRDIERHGKVLRMALCLLQTAEQVGSIVELEEPYRVGSARPEG